MNDTVTKLMGKHLSQDSLKEMLAYNEYTGVFTWARSNGNSVGAGRIAGSQTRDGYVQIRIKGVRYQAHHLAWLFIHGSLPDQYIDHVNRVKNDNRISNLRLASACENQQNVSISIRNKSGCPGVSWDKRNRTWKVRIMKNYEYKFIGNFSNLEDATDAYVAAKRELHTFHPEVNTCKPCIRANT